MLRDIRELAEDPEDDRVITDRVVSVPWGDAMKVMSRGRS